MYRMYAADSRARINLGIRRRLAPLLENDRALIELMNSLLLSMPGTPVLYYGDEIGMGDNIFLGDRDGVRTPMQWTSDRNGGFSRADPQRLYLPPIQDPIYGFEAVNVEAQSREPSSLLNWTRRLLAVRGTSHAFGRGRFTMLHPGNRKVLAYVREYEDDVILCVANVSRTAQPVELELRDFKGRVPVEMMGRNAFPPIGELPYLLTLPAHGFFWFRLATDVEPPRWHADALAAEDLPVLVLFDGWNSFFRGRVVPWRIGMAEKTRNQLERALLPRFLLRQRWYGAKTEPLVRVVLAEHVMLEADGQQWLLALADAEGPAGRARYFVPLTLAFEAADEERTRALAGLAVSRVRQQAEVGLLADAMADEPFCRALVGAIGAGRELPADGGRLRFTPSSAFAEVVGDALRGPVALRRLATSSNSVCLLGDRLFLKAYRRLHPGVNPELEMGRFLTDVAATRTACRSPAASSTSPPTARSGRSPCCRRRSRTRATRGRSRSTSWCACSSRSAPRPRRPTRASAPWRGACSCWRSASPSCTSRWRGAAARRPSTPSRCRRPTSNAGAGRCRTNATTRSSCWRGAAATGPSRWRRSPRASSTPHRSSARACARRGPARAASRPACTATITSARCCARERLRPHRLRGRAAAPARGAPRASTAPLRDVAGMLRSFDYARRTALHQTTPNAAEIARLGPAAREWERQARAAFVQTYGKVAVEGGLYADLAAFEAASPLLDLFEIEKALYELRYEMDNRPDWVAVPLAGIAALGRHPGLKRRVCDAEHRRGPRSGACPAAADRRLPAAPGGRDRRAARRLAARQGTAPRGRQGAARAELPRPHRTRRHRRLPAAGRHRQGHHRPVRLDRLRPRHPRLADHRLQQPRADAGDRPARAGAAVRAEAAGRAARADLRQLLRPLRRRRGAQLLQERRRR